MDDIVPIIKPHSVRTLKHCWRTNQRPRSAQVVVDLREALPQQVPQSTDTASETYESPGAWYASPDVWSGYYDMLTVRCRSA
jgi:hypothetical protein